MPRRQIFLLLLALLSLALLALGLWLYLRSRAPKPPIPDRLVLTPAGFADLPGWREDDLAAALPAFLRSCARIGRLAEGATLGGVEELAGTAGEWKRACADAARVPPTDRAAARAFFEAAFTPVAASNH